MNVLAFCSFILFEVIVQLLQKTGKLFTLTKFVKNFSVNQASMPSQ